MVPTQWVELIGAARCLNSHHRLCCLVVQLLQPVSTIRHGVVGLASVQTSTSL